MLLTRDHGRRFTRLGWWLGYYVVLWRCRVFGHRWHVWTNGPDAYGPTVACLRCDEIARDA